MWADRQLTFDQLFGECFLNAAMEGGVEFGGWSVCCGVVTLDDERIGPVVAMIDDAAASESTAEAQVIIGECVLRFGDALGVAEGDCGFCPAVVSKGGDTLGECVEQGGIDGHVGGGVAKGVGQDNEGHRASGLCVG